MPGIRQSKNFRREEKCFDFTYLDLCRSSFCRCFALRVATTTRTRQDQLTLPLRQILRLQASRLHRLPQTRLLQN